MFSTTPESDNAEELNLDDMIQSPRRRSFLDECKAGQSKRDRQALRKILEGKRSTTKRAPEDVTARRIRNLGKTMGLSPMDVAILNFLTRCETQTIIESMVDEVCEVTFRRRPAKPNVKDNLLKYLLDGSVDTIRSRA